jgi:hypothetical protein
VGGGVVGGVVGGGVSGGADVGPDGSVPLRSPKKVPEPLADWMVPPPLAKPDAENEPVRTSKNDPVAIISSPTPPEALGGLKLKNLVPLWLAFEFPVNATSQLKVPNGVLVVVAEEVTLSCQRMVPVPWPTM